MRRNLCVTVAAVAFIGASFIPMQVGVRQESSWVDAVSGSMKRETVSAWGRSAGEVAEPSALATRLRRAGIAWTPEWRFLHTVNVNAFGRAVGYECGTAPPIYQIRPVLGEFARGCNDDGLREFVRVMQTGTEAEREAVVGAAGEKGLRALEADRTGD